MLYFIICEKYGKTEFKKISKKTNNICLLVLKLSVNLANFQFVTNL